VKATVDKLQIGLVLAITLIGGGSFHYSRLLSQVDFNTAKIAGMDAKLDRILEMKGDMELMRKDIQSIQRMGKFTKVGVKSIDSRLAQLNESIQPFTSYYQSPFTQN
jgi:uncharacterized protein YktB (UPF0637 family)